MKLQLEPSALKDADGFRHVAEVRSHELGACGSILPMWYLAYFDDAMTAWFRGHGVPHAATCIQIVRTELDLHDTLIRSGDMLEIAARPTRITRDGFTFEFTISPRGAEHAIVASRTVYASVAIGPDGAAARQPLPPSMRDALQANFLADFDNSG